eukprot:556295-Alexandrium_andersonii.AAC.1
MVNTSLAPTVLLRRSGPFWGGGEAADGQPFKEAFCWNEPSPEASELLDRLAQAMGRATWKGVPVQCAY